MEKDRSSKQVGQQVKAPDRWYRRHQRVWLGGFCRHVLHSMGVGGGEQVPQAGVTEHRTVEKQQEQVTKLVTFCQLPHRLCLWEANIKG